MNSSNTLDAVVCKMLITEPFSTIWAIATLVCGDCVTKTTTFARSRDCGAQTLSTLLEMVISMIIGKKRSEMHRCDRCKRRQRLKHCHIVSQLRNVRHVFQFSSACRTQLLGRKHLGKAILTKSVIARKHFRFSDSFATKLLRAYWTSQNIFQRIRDIINGGHSARNLSALLKLRPNSRDSVRTWFFFAFFLKVFALDQLWLLPLVLPFASFASCRTVAGPTVKLARQISRVKFRASNLRLKFFVKSRQN